MSVTNFPYKLQFSIELYQLQQTLQTYNNNLNKQTRIHAKNVEKFKKVYTIMFEPAIRHTHMYNLVY